MAEGGVMKSRHGEGTLRLALAFAAFLGSLSMVIWRQSRALEVLRDLDGARVARAGVESDKSRQVEMIQRLESLARITSHADRAWGMRVPSSDEEFVIMLRPGAAESSPDFDVPAPPRILSIANLPPGGDGR
jgi:hypothetical protein